MATSIVQNVTRFLIVVNLVLPTMLYAQANDSAKPKLLQYDFRDKTPKEAVLAGLSASKQAVIVVLVRGGDKKLIEEVSGTMTALLHNDFERIGLLLGNKFPNEEQPVIAVYAQDAVYAVIENARADASTKLKVFNLVRDAYEEHITPLLKKSGNN